MEILVQVPAGISPQDVQQLLLQAYPDLKPGQITADERPEPCCEPDAYLRDCCGRAMCYVCWNNHISDCDDCGSCHDIDYCPGEPCALCAGERWPEHEHAEQS